MVMALPNWSPLAALGETTELMNAPAPLYT
jgi:hypothetical protein